LVIGFDCQLKTPKRQGYPKGIGYADSQEEFAERYSVLSPPLTHVSAKSPPTITLIGTSDRLVAVDQAEPLNQALSKASAPHEMYLLPGNNHGFDADWGGFGTQITRAKIERFLQQYGCR
jgi:acetyl esterase/lipase